MEIIMFIIFIVTNLFIILCMQFAYTHAYKYENGMYLNVHIPSSHKEDAEVTEIVTTGKRKMKHFQIANVCSEKTKRMDNRSPTQKGLYRHPRFSRSRCHDSQL